MADRITATVTCSFTPEGEEEPVVKSATFEFDPDNNFDEPIDIEYQNASSGGPVFLPKNMPTGL